MKESRKETIRATLAALGDEATTREIAVRCGMNVNGVSQTLGTMSDEIECVQRYGRAGIKVWRFKRPSAKRCEVCGGLNPGDVTHTRCHDNGPGAGDEMQP